MTQAANIVEYYYEESQLNETSPDEVSSQLFSILQNYETLKSNEEIQLENLKILLSEGSNYLSKIKQNQNRFVQSLAFEVTKILSEKMIPQPNTQLEQYINQNFYSDVQAIAKRLHHSCIDSSQKQTTKMNQLISQKIVRLQSFFKEQKKDGDQMKTLITKLEEFSKQNVIQIPVEMQVPKEIYEIPIQMEMENQRDYYEIPVQMELQKQACDISIQTDDFGSDIRIIEVPIEINVLEDQLTVLNSGNNPSQIKEIDNYVEFSKRSSKNPYEIPAEMNNLQQTVKNSIQTVDLLKQKLLGMSAQQNQNNQKQQDSREVKIFNQVIEVPIIIEKIIEVQYEVIVEKIVEIPVFVGEYQEVEEKKIKILKKKEQKAPTVSRLSYRQPKDSSLNSYIEDLIDHRIVGNQQNYQRLHSTKPQEEYEEIEEVVWETKQIDIEKHLCPYQHGTQKIVIETPIIQEKILERVVQIPVMVKEEVEISVIQEVEEKIVEKIVEVPIMIEKIVEKIIEVPILKETIVQVPIFLENQKEVQIPTSKTFESPHPNQEEQPIALETGICEEEYEIDMMEVPIEVIVEKEVIIEKIVEKIIEVPIIIEKIVRVQVPVEIEKIVEVQKIIQVPMELIVERQIFTEVEIPIPVTVEKIIEEPILIRQIVEVPIEVIIEKQTIVEKPIVIREIVEVPYEVIIEKQVIVEKPIVIRELVEVPYEVIVERIVERVIERPVYIQRIIEVPIIHQKIVQVPILLMSDYIEHQNVSNNLIEQDVPLEGGSYEASPIDEETITLQTGVQDLNQDLIVGNLQSKPVNEHQVLQIPVEIIIEKIVEKFIEVPIITEKIVHIEMPVEIQKIVEVQRIVEIERIVEVPIEVIVQKEIIIEKPVIIKQIVEVPYEVIIEKEIFIQKPVVVREIVQVPVQVVLQKVIIHEKPILVKELVEVPYEVIVEKQLIVERPVLIKQMVEIPVEILTEKQIIIRQIVQIPCEMIIQKEEELRFVTNDELVEIEHREATLVIEGLEGGVEINNQMEGDDMAKLEAHYDGSNQKISEQKISSNEIIEIPTEVYIQVPVRVEVQVEKIIERPIEVIIEKIVEVIKQFSVETIVEVPIQVIVQKVVWKQVEKIVEVTKILEVVVEKEVQVPVQILQQVQVPVQIIREVEIERVVQVPIQVYIEKIVEVFIEKVVEVPTIVEVQKIVQVPVEIFIQVEKIVEIMKEVSVIEVIEVPVQIFVDRPLENTVQLQAVNLSQDQKYCNQDEANIVGLQNSYDPSTQTFQLQVSKKEKVQIFEVPVIVEVQKITQVPIIQKVIVQVPVQVEKIVEVPIFLERIVEVPVQIIVYVDRQVPIIEERIVQVEKIVEVPIEVIIQRPIEVIVQRIVEVPVKIYIEKLVETIVEVPVEVIVEKPVEVFIDRIVEVPVQMMLSSIEIKHTEQDEEIINLQQSPNQYANEVDNLVGLYNAPPAFNLSQKQIIEIPVELETIVQKIIEVPIYLTPQKEIQIVEVPVEIQTIVEKIIQVPVYIQSEKQIKVIEVPVQIMVEKIIEVPVEIEKIVEVPIIVEKIIEKIIEIPVYMPSERQIVQVPVQVQRIVYVDRVVEKIIEVPVIIEVEKIVQKLVEVPMIMLDDQTFSSPRKFNSQSSNLINTTYEDNYMSSQEQLQYPGKFESGAPILIETNDDFTASNNKIDENPVYNNRDISLSRERYLENELERSKNVVIQTQVIEVPIEIIVEKMVQKVIEVPVEIIVQKIVEVPVEIVKEKIIKVPVEVPVEIIVERIVQVPIQTVSQRIIERIVQKIIEVPIITEKIVQVPIITEVTSSIQTYTYEKLYSIINLAMDQINEEEKVSILCFLKEKYANFFDQDKAIYEIPVEINIEQQEDQKELERAIYQIPLQIHIAPEESQKLLLQNSNQNIAYGEENQFQYNLQQQNIKAQLKGSPTNNLEEIIMIEGDSITHNDEEMALGQKLQGSLEQQSDNHDGAPTYMINRIIIGKGNVDSSIESDRNDEFQKLKNLNVSAIKNEQHEQHNLFGSINAVIGGRPEYGLNPKIQLDLRDNSSFDCGDHTGKQMKIDGSHYLDPNRNMNGVNGMPILLENTEEISRTNDNFSGIREKIIIDEQHFEQIEKLKNELNYLHEDNEANKKQLAEVSLINTKLYADLQSKHLEIETLTQKILTFSMQKDNEILIFKSEKNEVESFVHKLKEDNQALTREIKEIRTKHQRLEEKYEKTSNEHTDLKIKYNTEVELLSTELFEKKTQVKELKAEEHEMKNYYETQLSEITEELKSFKNEIQKLEEEIIKKEEMIEKLNHSHEELRNKLCLTLSGQSSPQATTTDMYEQQFLRIKEKFELQSEEKSQKIIELTFIIQNLEEEAHRERRNIRELEEQVMTGQRNYEQLLMINEREKTENELKLYELETKLNEIVLSIQQQNYDLRDRNNEKSIIIEKLRKELIQFGQKQHLMGQNRMLNESSKDKVPPTSKKESQISSISAAVKIQHVGVNRQANSHSNTSFYIEKLQSLTIKYERIIDNHQQMIAQLQQRVYQYLKDALEKQQQAESLYTKLYEYENTINSILVEKITLELENKRLKKLIAQSERKLELLGNQLIKVARESIEYREEEDEDFEEEEEEDCEE